MLQYSGGHEGPLQGRATPGGGAPLKSHYPKILTRAHLPPRGGWGAPGGAYPLGAVSNALSSSVIHYRPLAKTSCDILSLDFRASRNSGVFTTCFFHNLFFLHREPRFEGVPSTSARAGFSDFSQLVLFHNFFHNLFSRAACTLLASMGITVDQLAGQASDRR